MNIFGVFEISPAKREILQQLAERDWTPTELADELGKSVSTVYNHLDELADRGILSSREVPAKTRPRTQYSLGPGFLHYLWATPGTVRQDSLGLDTHKRTILRIWNIPQPSFHPYAEQFWWHFRTRAPVDLEADVAVVALFGSVARGTAADGADLDVLVLARGQAARDRLGRVLGSVQVSLTADTKRAVCEVFTTAEFFEGERGGFLDTIRTDLHVLYDPDRLLPDGASKSEAP